DDFFAIGGHSLLATQVVSRVHEALQVELPLRDLFEFPTVRTLAHLVEDARVHGRPVAPPLKSVDRRVRLPLSFAQQRLWLLDQFEPESATYNIARTVRLRGVLHVPALYRSLNEIVRRHEILRTAFPAQNGQPVQVIQPVRKLAIPLVD